MTGFSFLRSTPTHPTLYATGLVDLDRRVLIDLVEGNSGRDLRRWLGGQQPEWLAGIGVVATDLAESYRAGLAGRLDHATRVADPFHVVWAGNRCLDVGHHQAIHDGLSAVGPSPSWSAATRAAGRSDSHSGASSPTRSRP